MSASCWTARYEADGYSDWVKWMIAHIDDEGDLFAESQAICLLPDGHEGPHEFTPPSDIGVAFAGEGE